MKLEFCEAAGARDGRAPEIGRWRVEGETCRLTDVVLSPPQFLAPVPCCSVTRESIRKGLTTDQARAGRQHRELQQFLEAQGVSCHLVPPVEGMPDLSFTRDVAVTTPWGPVALNPALEHRRIEVEPFLARAAQAGARPVARITAGTIEGGDVCVARPGLVIIGCSGERTDAPGAEALATLFRHFGWEALLYDYDPHFLHLDTLFCMLDDTTALACVDVLADSFLNALRTHGIEVLPVTYKEARNLGCNILSIDGRTIVVGAGHDRIAAQLRGAGFVTHEIHISEFAACGGGIHCLTMPLRRV